MVIMENPADGSSEESGSGEEEPNIGYIWNNRP